MCSISGRKQLLLRTKYVVPRRIDHRILEMSIRRRQSNFRIVFSITGCEVKDYYRVVSVGQFGFVCRSYCGHSPTMQGVFYRLQSVLYSDLLNSVNSALRCKQLNNSLQKRLLLQFQLPYQHILVPRCSGLNSPLS